jgi:hypothetical protein
MNTGSKPKRKEVIKGVRLEPEIAFLAEVLAASKGRTFSDFVRGKILDEVAENLAFIKAKLDIIRDVLDHFEKSEPSPDMLTRAAIVKTLYPGEGATAQDYIWYIRAEEAAKRLHELGFEKGFAEQIAFDYFWILPAEKAIEFKKSLDALSALLEREKSLDHAMRQAKRKYFGEEVEK